MLWYVILGCFVLVRCGVDLCCCVVFYYSLFIICVLLFFFFLFCVEFGILDIGRLV